MAFVPVQNSKNVLRQHEQQMIVIVRNVAFGELKADGFCLIADDQMKFVPIKPAGRSVPPLGNIFKLFVLMYAVFFTNGQFGVVNEGESCAITR